MGGGHEAPRKLTHEEMAKAEIPLQFRDACAHLLLPLMKCRDETFFMPWKCGHERHTYEKCQYIEWKKRAKDEKVAAAAKLEAGGGL